MALSFVRSRRGQTSLQISQQQQQQPQQQRSFMQKQHSFIDAERKGPSSQGRPQLKRGLSVDRTVNDNYRQRLVYPVQRQKSIFGSKGDIPNTTRLTKRSGVNVNRQLDLAGGREKRIVAWASTSSLQKSLDNELSPLQQQQQQTQAAKGVKAGTLKPKLNARFTSSDCDKRKQWQPAKTIDTPDAVAVQPVLQKSNGEVSRINLSIKLSQALSANGSIDNELGYSDDLDSSSEAPTAYTNTRPAVKADTKDVKNAQYRRAQYQSNRQATLTSGLAASTAATSAQLGNSNNNSSSPSVALGDQRRPPLVRAMSAPVRSMEDNQKGQNTLANKRKLRRRKFVTRNLSSDGDNDSTTSNNNSKDILLNGESNGAEGGGGGGKKVLSRARSTATAADIITFVSMISSEGSDSEKEDTVSTIVSLSEKSPSKRAPLLRKTGKSVSFQENYPPNFQLATKDYSHMIRRGSIAPLAARLRTSRPPTAPAGSIFIPEKSAVNEVMSNRIGHGLDSSSIMAANKPRSPITTPTESTVNCVDNVTVPDYDYPEYVRSIKERECWKLFQKMSTKGVKVTYETVSRGMLTPTEFRQLQKQRDHVEAKEREAQEAAAAALAALNEKPKPKSAIDRLSEALLKK